MGIRELIHQKPAVAYSAVGLLIVIAVLNFIFMSSDDRPDHRVEAWYFYDVGTKGLFQAPVGAIPPIEAPSGKEGYRAYIFSCTDCSDADARFVGLLHTHTEEALAAIDGDRTDPAVAEAYKKGTMIRTPDSEQWVQEDSPEGQALRTAIYKKCGGGHKTKGCDVQKQ